jgi:hypothetical protein
MDLGIESYSIITADNLKWELNWVAKYLCGNQSPVIASKL